VVVVTYPIPLEALDDRLGWIGTSGSGKTYNASAGVERLLANNARVGIVDPLGVWWGLRLTADGKPSKHNVVIFGGEHGDLPLNEHAGKLIGETVAGMGESFIIDLSQLGTKAAERRFMLAFLESWYRNANGEPVHPIFDEADLWAPQRTTEPMLQSRMEEIVRRGRIRGFIPWLITQRPAVVSKDVLSQMDGLVAFKLTSSQDRDALGGWIEGQADRAQGKEILGSLPTMQRGEGVVWVPSRGILATVTFPPKLTFDSSRTPKRGERREARALKPLDLDKLKGRLSSIEEEAKASDPKALKAEVARLMRELAKAEKAKATTTPAPAKPTADVAALEEQVSKLSTILANIAPHLRLAFEEVRQFSPIAMGKQPRANGKTFPTLPAVERESAPTGGPGQRILNSLAWWKALGHDTPLNEQVAFIAGYSHTSTGYTNPRGALKTAGLVDYPMPGRVCLTAAGEEKAEAPEAPPSGDVLRSRVLGKLAGPQQRILGVLIDAYPEELGNDECSSRAGYSASSTGYTNPRGNLKTLNLVTYPASGKVRAAEWLFPVRAK
jgi:hypothetical protein